MEGMFLPVLSHFQNENIWIASDGKLRYQVSPVTVEKEDGTKEELLMTDDGIEELRAWLILESMDINARPDKSLEENMARREAAIQARKDAENKEKEGN